MSTQRKSKEYRYLERRIIQIEKRSEEHTSELQSQR